MKQQRSLTAHSTLRLCLKMRRTIFHFICIAVPATTLTEWEVRKVTRQARSELPSSSEWNGKYASPSELRCRTAADDMHFAVMMTQVLRSDYGGVQQYLSTFSSI